MISAGAHGFRFLDPAEMRHRVSVKVRLCGIRSRPRVILAASTLPQGRFMRHGSLEKGLPCGIDFEKNGPCRLRMQHPGSPEAAPIKAEVAISSPLEVSQGEFLGQITAACLPHESRKTARKVACLSGFWAFVSFVTDPERKKGDPRVALFVAPVARLL